MPPAQEPTEAFATPAPALPTVPKLPFIIVDVMLLLAALWVWERDAPLGRAQLLACLGAVGLGAVLAVLPFIMEYQTRIQLRTLELEQARVEDFQRLAGLDGEMRKQARAALETQEQVARATAALEGSARRFDARLAPLAEAEKSLAATSVKLAEAAAVQTGQDKKELQREIDRLRQSQASQLQSAVENLSAVARELHDVLELAAQPGNPPPTPTMDLTPILAAIATIREQLGEMAPPEKPMAPVVIETPAAVAPPPARLATEAHEEDAAAETAAPVTVPELSNTPLMTKALASTQPTEESSAVSRIIQSRPRRPRKAKTPEGSEPPAAPEANEPSAALPEPVAPTMRMEPAVSAPATGGAEAWESLASGEFDAVTDQDTKAPAVPSEPVMESAAEAMVAEADAAIENAPTAPTAVLEAPPVAAPSEASVRPKVAVLREDEETETPPPAQVELLAPVVTEHTRHRRTKTSAEGTTLVARILIGIGNKPYVRGKGPGLSPDKGVPMEFVEIGQWRWVAPTAARGPLTLRLFKNDEVPAAGEPIILEPGQTLEVSPVFPK